MAKKNHSTQQNGGFIKLPRHLEQQPEVARLLDEKGATGLGIYIHLNLYLASCKAGWGVYTGRQFAALAAELKRKRSEVRDVIDNYGLFIVDGERFTSPWMQQQFGQDGSYSRATLYTHAEEIEIEKDKKHKEKATGRVSADTPAAFPQEEEVEVPTLPPVPPVPTCNYQQYTHYLNR